MDVRLIQVPYMLGGEHHGACSGPQRFVQAGVASRLALRGVAVTTERVERGAPFRDSASASLAVNRRLKEAVARALAAGQFPLVVAGSCDASMGVLSGFDHTGCGVVWIDAHGDFNTPESTVTGFFGGMSLAVVVGHCYRHWWAQVGNSTPIAESAVVMLGVRDLDPEEADRLERSAISVVPWRDGRPLGEVPAALDALAKRVREVYLHIDLDGLDPHVAPGVVDAPVPGGLSLEDTEAVIRAAGARFRLRAATISTYDPELDRDDRTLRAGLRIIERLVECGVGTN